MYQLMPLVTAIPNRPAIPPAVGPVRTPPDSNPAAVARVVRSIVRSLVDHPSLVRAEKRLTPHTVTIVVHVAPSDMPLVIGRRGRTARALRSLLVRFRNRDQRKYRLTFRALQVASV